MSTTSADASAVGRVVTDRRGPDRSVLWVSMDHPPVNALDAGLRAGLLRAAREGHDPDVRVVVLTGLGRSFSAGGDIGELAELATHEDGEQARRVHGQYLDVYRDWLQVPVPTIAAVRGYALGGALELALSCDLRYATGDTFFAASGVRMGLVESAHSLPGVVGGTTAAEMLFTGGRVSAPDAYARGLLTRVVADLEAEVAQVADSIAQHPTSAVRATKAVLRATREGGRAAGGETAVQLWRQLQSGAAHRQIAGASAHRARAARGQAPSPGSSDSVSSSALE